MNKSVYRIKIRKGDIEIEVEGDKKYVDEKLRELEERFIKGLTVAVAEAEVKPKRRRGRPPKSPKPIVDISELKEFLRKVKPRTRIEKIATIAYFLQEKGHKTFRNAEMSVLMEHTGTKIVNLSEVLKRAIRAKTPLLTRVDIGEWTLTEEGRNFVSSRLK